MSHTDPDAITRAVIGTITHDAIAYIIYNFDVDEFTVTFIDGTILTASEHCWYDEVTEENVNGYSWVIHNPGNGPLDRHVSSGNHGDDLRDAIIEHADSVTPLPAHEG